MPTYHCSNCREKLADDAVKKIAIGTDRNVVFCKACNCYVTLEEKKVAPAKKAE